MEEYRSGHNGAVLKTVRVQAHVGSNPTSSANADVAQLVEHNLAKVGVASSSLVVRSIYAFLPTRKFI